MQKKNNISTTEAHSVPEVAKRLQCSQRMVWKLIAQGKLGRMNCGRLIRVPNDALIAYMEKNYKPAIDAAGLAQNLLKR